MTCYYFVWYIVYSIQVPLKLEQNVTKSSNTKPLPDQDFDQPNVQDIRLERLKFDDIDQDSGFSDFDSLQRSKNSASISPESIEANRINDQTPSPTTAEYSSPVQTPTCKDPGENHFGKSVLFTKILVNIY